MDESTVTENRVAVVWIFTVMVPVACSELPLAFCDDIIL